MENIQKDITDWAANTFKQQTVGSKIKHLKREIKELEENPGDGQEMADCAILLFGLAGIQNIDLLNEVKIKMEKNKLRKWGEPDSEGVQSHIE